MNIDPYKILGIGKDADLATVKSAYRAAVQKHHPDRGGDAWAFQQVQEAYETLMAEGGSEVEVGSQATNAAPHATEASGDGKPNGAETIGGESSALESFRVRTKGWLNGATQELQLESETCFFILVNVLDFYMTYVLLNTNGIEANPFAAFVYNQWGFEGMLAFKLITVAIVCLVVQIIAKRKLQTARYVLWAGILIIGAVVVYSAMLIRGLF